MQMHSALICLGGVAGCVRYTLQKYALQLNCLWLTLRVRWNLKLQQLHINPSWTGFSALSNVSPMFLLHWGSLMDRRLKVKSLMRKLKQKDYSSLWRGHGKILKNGIMGMWHALSAGLGADIKVKELVMDNVIAVCVVFMKRFLWICSLTMITVIKGWLSAFQTSEHACSSHRTNESLLSQKEQKLAQFITNNWQFSKFTNLQLRLNREVLSPVNAILSRSGCDWWLRDDRDLIAWNNLFYF